MFNLQSICNSSAAVLPLLRMLGDPGLMEAIATLVKHPIFGTIPSPACPIFSWRVSSLSGHFRNLHPSVVFTCLFSIAYTFWARLIQFLSMRDTGSGPGNLLVSERMDILPVLVCQKICTHSITECIHTRVCPPHFRP